MQQLELNQHNLSRAAAKLGCDVLRGVCLRTPGANVVVSPMSLYYVTAMLACGAHGQTQVELAALLGWRDQEAQKVNAAIAWLDEGVRGSSRLLSVANGMFPDLKYAIYEQFAATMGNYFQADVLPVNYSTPDHLAEINGWVSDKTAGKIAHLLDQPLTADTAMVLMNAVHFKGTWQEPFSEDKTYPDRFNLDTGAQVMVKMMHKTSNIKYFDDQYCQAVCLPYQDFVGAVPRFEAVVMLPRPGVQIDTLIGDFLLEWLMRPSTNSCEINLQLPRTRIASTQMLNQELSALGAARMFDPQTAEFGKISPDLFFLSFVLQSATLDVDEQGTVAAAATMAAMGWGSAPAVPVLIRFDRPFIFAVRDTQTGCPWFIARVMNPLG